MEKGLAAQNLPDLLLMDGGKGQLQVAVEVLGRFGLLQEIDLVAIAKEKQEEGEKLFRPGRKDAILLPGHAPVLLYLMRIRDEAHRFGISFHRRLRGKAQFNSVLDQIAGIGPQRKKRLLKSFGSVRRIREAELEELAAVPGIGRELAQAIKEQLQPDV